MKYLLKEDKMQGLIEKYIKSQFDDIVSVNFEKIKVRLEDFNKSFSNETPFETEW